MSQPGHILVVEDERAIAGLLTTQVERLGHTCLLATDGSEAIRMFLDHRFDLVLLDLKLRSVDGFDALKGIRQIESERGTVTPVVAVTAFASNEYRHRCFTAGFDDFLTK